MSSLTIQRGVRLFVAIAAVVLASTACGGSSPTATPPVDLTAPDDSVASDLGSEPADDSESGQAAQPADVEPVEPVEVDELGEFAGLVIDGPLAGCGAIDGDRLSEIVGTTLYSDGFLENAPTLPNRSCTIRDDEGRALFYIDIQPDQDHPIGLWHRSNEAGFLAGGEDTIGFSTLLVEAGSTTLAISGRLHDGTETTAIGDVSYVALSQETLVQVLDAAVSDITSAAAEPAIANLATCAELPVSEIGGSPIERVDPFDFNGLAGCSAQAANGDRLAVTIGNWSRSSGYLEDIVGEYDWSARFEPMTEIVELDDRLRRGVLANDINPHFDGAFRIDEAYFVAADDTYVHVSVLGEAALGDDYDAAALQQIALDVLFAS